MSNPSSYLINPFIIFYAIFTQKSLEIQALYANIIDVHSTFYYVIICTNDKDSSYC
jgi:hypothetical protein